MTDRADIHERTRRTLSREFDEPGVCTKDSVKRARAHLGRCPQCRAFESALADGTASGATRTDERASDELVARILGAVQAQRVEGSAETSEDSKAGARQGSGIAEPAATGETPTGGASHRSAGRRRTAPWFPRLALGITAAAAVVALFFGARFAADHGLVGGLTGARSATQGVTAGTAESSARTAAPQGAPDAVTGLGGSSKAGAAGAPVTRPAPSGKPLPEPMTAPVPAVVTPDLGPGAAAGFAPPVNPLAGRPVLLTFGSAEPYRRVWRFSGWLRNTPSNILIKVSAINASLGAGGWPLARAVYERVGDSSEKYVWWADDDYQVYRPVTMRLQGATADYSLVSAGAIPDWGFWPTWPRSVTGYPAGATMAGATVDNARGVAVYLSGSTPASAGFAVAPASRADPVARIPKWTWYSSQAPAR
jgi:hypothetical protein